MRDCGMKHHDLVRLSEVGVAVLSHRMYSSISFRKSTPPHNRQLIIHF